MEEKKRYTAEEALNLQSAAYQKGYNEGYQLRKQEHPGGPGWVKASAFKTEEPCHRPYRRKSVHTGSDYDYGEIYITEDEGRIYLDIDNESSYEHQSDARWDDYEILDESPAEQPLVDNELKQEVDHLESKISLCEDALEKLHSERYETRLALRMLLKVFKNDQISKEQEKYYSQADYILNKHSNVTDVLRAEVPEQPGREGSTEVFVPCLEDDLERCGTYTSNDGQAICCVKAVNVPAAVIEKEVKP